MGRDIWVALERKDCGDWYNVDLYVNTEKHGIQRVPFYIGRNSALFDTLHELGTRTRIMDVSKETLRAFTEDFYNPNYCSLETFKQDSVVEILEVSKLCDYFVKSRENVELTFNEETIEFSKSLDLVGFYKDLREYIGITLKDQDPLFHRITPIKFRIVYYVW